MFLWLAAVIVGILLAVPLLIWLLVQGFIWLGVEVFLPRKSADAGAVVEPRTESSHVVSPPPVSVVSSSPVSKTLPGESRGDTLKRERREAQKEAQAMMEKTVVVADKKWKMRAWIWAISFPFSLVVAYLVLFAWAGCSFTTGSCPA